MWERQTFVCCYQSLFGSGNAEHVTLPPDPRARDGSGDRAGYVLVPYEPEPKYGPHTILGCPPCRRGNLHPLLGATPKALPRARHLLEPTQMTGLLSPRLKGAFWVILLQLCRGKAPAKPHLGTSPLPYVKIRPQRPIKKEKSPKAPEKRGHRRGKLPRSAANAALLHLSTAASNGNILQRTGVGGDAAPPGVCLQPPKRRLHIKKEETGVRMTHPFSEKLTETQLAPRDVVCPHQET